MHPPPFLHTIRQIILRRPHNPQALCCHFCTSITPTEVEVPVPWGRISGRLWNAGEGRKPVLCLHGWKDNAASFDNLLPLLIPALNHEYQFFAMDAPGHGFSSHYPPGMYYRFHDSYSWIVRSLRHLGWRSKGPVDVMGHSLGAMLGFAFTLTHAPYVNRLIAIEALTPNIFLPNEILRLVPEITLHMLKMDAKIEKVAALGEEQSYTYTWDEAYKVMLKSHMSGMHDTACKTLLTRGLTESKSTPGKYKFSHDIRVQYLPITFFSSRQVSFMAQNFGRGLLYIKAEDGVNYMSSHLRANIRQWVQAENDNHTKFVVVGEGVGHHLHLTHPQLIVNDISDFLLGK